LGQVVIAYGDVGDETILVCHYAAVSDFAEMERRMRLIAEARDAFRDFIHRFLWTVPDTRFVNPSVPARLRTGRRTREGRARNAVRQLPMLGAA